MDNLPQKRRRDQRASDADRDIVVGDLQDAFSEGRLDADEYEKRLDAVWKARTYGELDVLTGDLPQPIDRERAEAERARRQKQIANYLGAWRGWLSGAIIMIGIWLVSGISRGGFENFWPAMPLGIWGVIIFSKNGLPPSGFLRRDKQ